MAANRWAALRRFVLDRDGWRCQRCGRYGRMEVHHVDGDPMTDTNGAVVVRAVAFGPSLARRAVEATVLRHEDGRVGLVSWRVDQ